MNNQAQNCTVCNGNKINEVELQDLNKDKKLKYHPIECQHCKGTGKEPNNDVAY